MKHKKIFITILLLILILITSFAIIFIHSLSPVDKKNENIITFTVENGWGKNKIIKELKNKNLIRSELFSKIIVKFKNKELYAGTYKLSKDLSTNEILEIIENQKNIENESIKITFVEGKRLTTYVKQISDNFSYSEEDILNKLSNKDYLNTLINKYWFITEDILNEKIYYPLEGYLYPNTYMIYKDGNFKEVVYKMLDEMDNKLTPLKTQIENSQYSVHELITLASIVEQEGSLGSDRKGIAGVFTNRLNNDWNLGSCVTTYYGSKVLMGERDLYQREIDDCSNKYNTRCNSLIGLPIGPICNPSIESIEASLNPSNNNYYYFVSDINNNTYFSKTYNEHLNTISRLQREGIWYEY